MKIVDLLDCLYVEAELDKYNASLLCREFNLEEFPRFYRYPSMLRRLIYRAPLAFYVLYLVFLSCYIVSFYIIAFAVSLNPRKFRSSLSSRKVYVDWSSDINLSRLPRDYIPDVSLAPIGTFPSFYGFERKYDLNSFYTLSDVKNAFIICLKLLVQVGRQQPEKLLYSIYLPQLSLTYIALENTRIKDYVVTNNYDRWIFLLDRLASNLSSVNLICASHGDPIGTSQNGGGVIFDPGVRFENKWKIFYENNFSKVAFELLHRKESAFYSLKDTYTLSDYSSEVAVDVVLLGNMRLRKHITRVFRLLQLSSPDINIVYRKHPLERNPPREFLTHLDPSSGTVLTRTKVLLTYGSSLDLHYQTYACSKVVKLRDDGTNVDDIVSDILSFLSRDGSS